MFVDVMSHSRLQTIVFAVDFSVYDTFQLFYYLHCRLVIQLAPLSHDVTVDRFSPMATK